MPFHPFPVPARAHGTSHRFEVAHTNQSMLVSRLYRAEWTGHEFTVPVTLLDDPRGGGFKVKWDYGVIGTLPHTVRQRYPELNRILQSSLNPEVTARISQEHEALRISVELADPGLLLPVNKWPASPWMLMPYGEPIEIDVEISSSSVKQKLAACNHRQFLVRLALMDDDSIAVLAGGDELEDDVVGVLHEPAYTELKDAINHFEMLGLIPVARAYSWDGTATVEPIRTEDLTEEQLEPPISPMRQLVPESAAASGGSILLAGGSATITNKGNGQWALNMPSETFPAVTPERMAEYEAAISREESPKAGAESPETTTPGTVNSATTPSDTAHQSTTQEPTVPVEPPTETFKAVSNQKPHVGVDLDMSEGRRRVEEALKGLPETPLWPVPSLSTGPAYQRNTNRQRPRPVAAPRAVSRSAEGNVPVPHTPLERETPPEQEAPQSHVPEHLDPSEVEWDAEFEEPKSHVGRNITWAIVLAVIFLIILFAVLS